VQSAEDLDIAPTMRATEHLDIATRIVPFGRVALLKVTELLVTGSFGHDGALLTAARAATIESSPGRIKIDVGELIAAMRHLGRTLVDPTDAMASSRVSSQNTAAQFSRRPAKTTVRPSSTGNASSFKRAQSRRIGSAAANVSVCPTSV
jgi:hypothetical protein